MSKSFVKKEEKKNNIINYSIIGVIAILVLAMLVVVSNNNGNKAIAGNYIKEITYSEYKNKILDDNYTVLLLASPECSHCQDYKPFVNQLAGEKGLTVYYINVSSSDLTEEEYVDLRNSIKATKDQVDSKGNPIIPTPTTVIFKSGVEVSSELGDIGYNGFKKLLKNSGVI